MKGDYSSCTLPVSSIFCTAQNARVPRHQPEFIVADVTRRPRILDPKKHTNPIRFALGFFEQYPQAFLLNSGIIPLFRNKFLLKLQCISQAANDITPETEADLPFRGGKC